MSKTEVINGQLVKDGKTIKPEFGNMEHIKAIKRAERDQRTFTCGCGEEYDITDLIEIFTIES